MNNSHRTHDIDYERTADGTDAVTVTTDTVTVRIEADADATAGEITAAVHAATQHLSNHRTLADHDPDPDPTPIACPDGGVTYTDLTGFQRDCLLVVRVLTAEQATPPLGTDIRDRLDALYGESLVHSRVYQNLATLVEQDLVEQGQYDRRTNTYELTDLGRELLAARYARLRDALEDGAFRTATPAGGASR